MKTFENHLDKHWKEHPMIYDFNMVYMYNTMMAGSSTLTLHLSDEDDTTKYRGAICVGNTLGYVIVTVYISHECVNTILG